MPQSLYLLTQGHAVRAYNRTMLELLNNIWAVFLDTAFWLLVGLLAAGFIKSYISEAVMRRWVGGTGIAAVSRAALFGAPLPLCSCGVLPAAATLKKQGANNGAVTAFLIATPESGIDSISITWALLDPIMTVARPVSAFFSAVLAGIAENIFSFS